MSEYTRSPEYVEALEKMLQQARLLVDVGMEFIGNATGAIEAVNAAKKSERIATELLKENQK